MNPFEKLEGGYTKPAIVLVGVTHSEHKAIIAEILMKKNLKHDDVVIIETKEELDLYEKRNMRTIPIHYEPTMEICSVIDDKRKLQQDIRNQNKLRARHYKK